MTLPRFYPILDTALLGRRGMDAVAAAAAVLAGGARLLQLRHKAHFSRAVYAAAERIAEMCRDSGALFAVNDRADMAALLDAALHIGQDDIPPQAARRLLGRARVLGFSTHNEAQLRAAAVEPVDYLALGPIFATVSKSNPDPVVGLAELRRLRQMVAQPLVAIGGITRVNARETIAAGADCVAIIGDLLPESCDSSALRARTEEWIALLG